MNQLWGEINKAIERIPNLIHIFLIQKRKSEYVDIKKYTYIDETMHLEESIVPCTLVLLKHSIWRNR